MQAPFIRKAYLDVPFFSVREIFEREMPYIAAFSQDETFFRNIDEWMEFYAKNQQRLPYYQIDAGYAERIRQGLTLYMGRMREAVTNLFNENTDEQLLVEYPMPGVSKEANLAFIRYARWTEQQGHLAFGGRFDFSIDVQTGKVFIYELNGDTPAMLFESMNLQNMFSEVNNDMDAQLNEMWNHFQERGLTAAHSRVGVIVNTDWAEDLGTSEAVAQLFETTGAQVFLGDMTQFRYDPAGEPGRSPFFLESIPEVDLTDIHIMLPWEEMVESNPDAFVRWREWCTKVNFYEPAWRWFVSHKKFMTRPELSMEGLLAVYPNWLDFGIEVNTQLDAKSFTGVDHSFVSKPMLGRQSASVKLHTCGTTISSPNDNYADYPVIYQPYRAPGVVDGANFIGTMWFSGEEGVSLSFREFDHDILELTNERVIMHELT